MNLNQNGLEQFSGEVMIAKKFITNFINSGKVDDLVFEDTPDNIKKIKEKILRLGVRLHPNISSINLDKVIKTFFLLV